jgi:fatty-acyl-CoA synthase
LRYGAELAQVYLASGDPTGDSAEMSFAALAKAIRARATALAQLGIGRGDRVSLMTPQGLTSYATLIGTMVAATAAPLNYFLEADALIRLIRAARSRALLVSRTFDDDASAASKVHAIKAAIPELQIIAYGEGPPVPGSDDLEAAMGDGSDWLSAHSDGDPDRVVACFHTGGTTGRPKLVPHTERMYVAMLKASAVTMGTVPGSRMLAGLPLFHTSGALQTGLVPLLNACGIVIPSSRGFRAPEVIPNYWNYVSRFQINIGSSVPTILMALAGITPATDISCLRRVLCGAAPLPLATIQAIQRATGGAGVLEGWGMTETCGFSVLNPEGKTKVGSVGIPFEGVEAQVRAVGEDASQTAELPVDTVGELVVRGSIVIKAYADDRPDSFTPDGWLRTGDLARKDADGYLWIVGRLKDLIIRSGHNIDPMIIEGPAYEHPAVQLAAAVGRPDRYAGELPILFVQLREGTRADAEEIREFVAVRVHERAAAPKAVFIIKTMPLTGPGKIYKVALRYEATRATLQADVDAALGANNGVEVKVVEDSKSGIAVRLGGSASTTVRAGALAVLGGYPFKIEME